LQTSSAGCLPHDPSGARFANPPGTNLTMNRHGLPIFSKFPGDELT
jgi:hypothetical protein